MNIDNAMTPEDSRTASAVLFALAEAALPGSREPHEDAQRLAAIITAPLQQGLSPDEVETLRDALAALLTSVDLLKDGYEQIARADTMDQLPSTDWTAMLSKDQ